MIIYTFYDYFYAISKLHNSAHFQAELKTRIISQFILTLTQLKREMKVYEQFLIFEFL